MTESVAVPKVLLGEVLNDAESNSFTSEAECDYAPEHHAARQVEREKIRQLRSIAGLEDEKVVGQGFFGLAIALKEHKDIYYHDNVFTDEKIDPPKNTE